MQLTIDLTGPKANILSAISLLQSVVDIAIQKAQPEVANNTGSAALQLPESVEGGTVSGGGDAAPAAVKAKGRGRIKPGIRDEVPEEPLVVTESEGPMTIDLGTVTGDSPAPAPVVVEAQAPAPTPAPAPAAAPVVVAAAPAIDLDTLRDALQAYTTKNGMHAGKVLLTQFAAARVSDLKPHVFESFLTKAQS